MKHLAHYAMLEDLSLADAELLARLLSIKSSYGMELSTANGAYLPHVFLDRSRNGVPETITCVMGYLGNEPSIKGNLADILRLLTMKPIPAIYRTDCAISVDELISRATKENNK
jgi:hypothetical protein